ncbi:MAG TPA: hypothetical protein VHN17_03910 [Steroidobacteraceae bacterium]|jgi:hypothetical protein|nr:hypothetical protein [Steroidobacteraceae bacterium]
MRQLTVSAAALSLLIVWVSASGADDAWQPRMAFSVDEESNWQAGYGDFGRPGESSRETEADDIYRVKVDAGTAAPGDVRIYDQIQVFGKPGYYLYDTDAWQVVASGPIIGPLRQRTYSLFGSDSNNAALNRLTMSSEALRRNANGGSRWRASWSNPGWSF